MGNKDLKFDDFDWVDFDSQRYIVNKDPFITISRSEKNPRFYLNKNIMELINEKTDYEVKYFKVGLNIKEKIMALKPLGKYQKNTVKLYKKKKQKSGSFSNAQLMDKIREIISFGENEKSKRYKIKWNDDKKIFIVLLKKPLSKLEEE